MKRVSALFMLAATGGLSVTLLACGDEGGDEPATGSATPGASSLGGTPVGTATTPAGGASGTPAGGETTTPMPGVTPPAGNQTGGTPAPTPPTAQTEPPNPAGPNTPPETTMAQPPAQPPVNDPPGMNPMPTDMPQDPPPAQTEMPPPEMMPPEMMPETMEPEMMPEPEPDLDQSGKANAKPGDMTSEAQDYLRLGEIRILNNNWGSEDLGCNAPMSVFVNQDRSFGWTFNRGDCDTANTNGKPDFPQIEFGIHPFGIGSHLVTSPEFSSTDVLPLQIKDIETASVSVENLSIELQQGSSWNITFEFWLSQGDPLEPNPGVYAELMTFWGWQAQRWPDTGEQGSGPTGNGAGHNVPSGGKNYTLWVQDDSWADGWRYFQFRADDGPQTNFNGTLDVKPFLDYLVNDRQYSPDLWVTRLEVGSEIDDMTQGTVKMNNITFEVNGERRSPVFGE